MGALLLLVSAVGVLIGIVMLPTIQNIVSATTVTWAPLEAVVNLIPFGFLIIVVLGGIWTLLKLKGGD